MLSLNSPRISVTDAQRGAATRAVHSFLSRQDVAFPRLPSNEEIWTSSRETGKAWRSRFDELIWIGIGGSSLGPRVVAGLAGPQTKAPKVHFADNVDAELLEMIAARTAGVKKLGLVAVSKSGSTLETLATIEYFRQKLNRPEREIFHVLTESKDNALAKWALARQVPLTLIPADVGGRYSVLTPVGMALAEYLELDVGAFRFGAAAALREKDLLVSLCAQILASFERQNWITNFWFYSSRARDFGDWLQQLWAESLAKKTSRRGAASPRVSAPLISVGAVDQHSILQQVMEGARDRFVWIWRFDSAEAGPALGEVQFDSCRGLQGAPLGRLLAVEAEATERTLAEAGVPTLSLRTARLDESHLGHHFMLMQLLIACVAEALDIDAFDQPGVELGKRLAREILAKP